MSGRRCRAFIRAPHSIKHLPTPPLWEFMGKLGNSQTTPPNAPRGRLNSFNVECWALNVAPLPHMSKINRPPAASLRHPLSPARANLISAPSIPNPHRKRNSTINFENTIPPASITKNHTPPHLTPPLDAKKNVNLGTRKSGLREKLPLDCAAFPHQLPVVAVCFSPPHLRFLG